EFRHVLFRSGHAAAAGCRVRTVNEVGADHPGPFGPHDGLAAGHGGHADVTARPVAGVDAALGEPLELQGGQFGQAERLSDRVPDGTNTVVVNGVHDELDRRRGDLLQTVPELTDQLDALL